MYTQQPARLWKQVSGQGSAAPRRSATGAFCSRLGWMCYQEWQASGCITDMQDVHQPLTAAGLCKGARRQAGSSLATALNSPHCPEDGQPTHQGVNPHLTGS